MTKKVIRKQAKPAKDEVVARVVKLPPIEKKIITPGEIREKIRVLTFIPLPDGHVRCVARLDFQGMVDYHYKGDIFDLPERRYKSLANRGYVEPYFGDKQPNKLR